MEGSDALTTGEDTSEHSSFHRAGLTLLLNSKRLLKTLEKTLNGALTKLAPEIDPLQSLNQPLSAFPNAALIASSALKHFPQGPPRLAAAIACAAATPAQSRLSDPNGMTHDSGYR